MASLSYFGLQSSPSTVTTPSGTLTDRPTATEANENSLYFATDDFTGGPFGTLYLSLDSSWRAISGDGVASDLLFGTSAPSSGTGANGQLFLDKTNRNLYGPKTAGAWGNPMPLGQLFFFDSKSDHAFVAKETYRLLGNMQGALSRPDATNTGYLPHRTLSSLAVNTGDMTTTSDGQVIEGRNITGILTISHKNVIVRECWVQKYIRIDDPLANAFIIDNEIGTDEGFGEAGKAGICFSGYVALRNNIHGIGDGMKMYDNTAALGNYIHDLYRYPIGGGDYEHADGIQVSKGEHIDIIGNSLDIHTFVDEGAPVTADEATSAILCKADLGVINDVRIWHNWMGVSAPTHFTCYVSTGDWSADPIPKNVTVRNNLIRKGFTGYFNSTDEKSIRAFNRDWKLDGSIGDYIDPIPGSGNALRLPGDTGNGRATTPYVAARTPQSLYVEAEVIVEDAVSGGNQRILSQLDFTATASRAFSFFLDATGKLSLVWYTNGTGTSITAAMTNPLPIDDGERCKVAAWLNPSNPYSVTFYFAKYGADLTAVQVVTGGAATVINDGNTPYLISGRNSGVTERFKGDVLYAAIRDGGPAGTLVSEFDPTAVEVENPISPLSITSTTGEVWTIAGNATWVASREPSFDEMFDIGSIVTMGSGLEANRPNHIGALNSIYVAEDVNEGTPQRATPSGWQTFAAAPRHKERHYLGHADGLTPDMFGLPIFTVPRASGVHSTPDGYSGAGPTLKGDGVVDDSLAIQYVIDNLVPAAGGIVFIPYGVWHCKTTIDRGGKNNVIIRGAGPNATILQADDDIIVLDLSGTGLASQSINNHAHRLIVQDLTIDGGNNASWSTQPMVRSFYADNCAFIRVNFRNKHGIAHMGAEFWDSRFYQCRWDACGGIDGASPSQLLVNQSTSDTEAFGYSDDSTNGIHFHDCIWESYRDGALWVLGDYASDTARVDNIHLVDCRGDENNTLVTAGGAKATFRFRQVSKLYLDKFSVANTGLGSGQTGTEDAEIAIEAGPTGSLHVVLRDIQLYWNGSIPVSDYGLVIDSTGGGNRFIVLDNVEGLPANVNCQPTNGLINWITANNADVSMHNVRWGRNLANQPLHSGVTPTVLGSNIPLLPLLSATPTDSTVFPFNSLPPTGQKIAAGPILDRSSTPPKVWYRSEGTWYAFPASGGISSSDIPSSTWTAVHGSSTLASRPAAASGNAGFLWLVTDVNGGTLYRSTGSAWVQCAPGVSQAGGGSGSGSIFDRTVVETFSRELATSTFQTASGRLYLVYCKPSSDITITSLASAPTVAQAGATLVRLGLYSADEDGDLTLVAASANDTAYLTAAGNEVSKALDSGGGLPTSLLMDSDTWYAFGLLVVGASTQATMLSAPAISTNVPVLSPRMAGRVDSLTDLPTTIASGSVLSSGTRPYLTGHP